MTEINNYFAQNPVFFIFCASVLGLIIGSFLNVVIYRLPKMLESEWRVQCSALLAIDTEVAASPQPIFNLVSPNSHCPCCHHEIAPWHNIPVISFLLLKGKCHHCKAPIALRYPLLELICGLLTAFTAYHFGFTLTLLPALILVWSLIALTMIDIDHQLLPDHITLPLLWAGLIINSFNLLVPLQEAVWGAIAGYVSLWSVYWFFKLLTAKEGMGYGDFKLLAALGAWLGWSMLPLVVVLASLVGACVGIALMIFKKHRMGTPIAFGPYLAAAGLIALMWGQSLVNDYWLLFNF
jgi:leader peptidase (prepilin peptidase)/N-methyltransferase